MRFLFFLLIFIFSVLVTSNSYSQPSGKDSVKSVFEISYYNKGNKPDYFAGWCSNNIYNLISRFHQSGIDLSQAEVWFVYQRDQKGGLGVIYPQQSRSWAETGWVFHVILNLAGTIYDLDFTTAPAPTPAHQYFQKMFPVIGPKNHNLLVKIIPGPEFLEIYLKLYAQYPLLIFQPEAEEKYPPLLLEEVLNNKL